MPLASPTGQSTFDFDEYVYGALRAGASGFVLKDTPGHLLAKLQARDRAQLVVAAYESGLVVPARQQRGDRA